MIEIDSSRRKCRVALRLEPRFADDLRLQVAVGRRGVALLDERRVTLPHRVVVRHLPKVDLARLPKALLALLLLHCGLFRKSRSGILCRLCDFRSKKFTSVARFCNKLSWQFRRLDDIYSADPPSCKTSMKNFYKTLELT